MAKVICAASPQRIRQSFRETPASNTQCMLFSMPPVRAYVCPSNAASRGKLPDVNCAPRTACARAPVLHGGCRGVDSPGSDFARPSSAVPCSCSQPTSLGDPRKRRSLDASGILFDLRSSKKKRKISPERPGPCLPPQWAPIKPQPESPSGPNPLV